MVLQGKGGVGKSFVSTLIAQYSANKGQSLLCIDTDPINSTFFGFQSLDVHQLNIMENDEIHSRHFDTLIEMIAKSTQDVVIDNGASSFVALSHYMINNQLSDLLSEMGHELRIHTVITGGQALSDTMNGFAQLVKQFPDETKFIVWLNPYWGKINYQGKGFEQMKIYLENKEKVSGIIPIPELKAETFGRDVSDMLKERLTFNEAISSPDRTIMTRQRLKIVRDSLFNLLDNAVI